MNYEDIKEKLKEENYPNPIALGKSKAYKDLKESIFEATKFLGDESSAVFRAYCILNDITEVPTCPECGGKVSKKQNTDVGESVYDTYIFTTFCSKKCARTSQLTVDKRMGSIKAEYGDHNMRTERGQKEYKESFETKYGEGITHPMHVKEFADKALKTEDGQWRVTTDVFKEKAKETKNKS